MHIHVYAVLPRCPACDDGEEHRPRNAQDCKYKFFECTPGVLASAVATVPANSAVTAPRGLIGYKVPPAATPCLLSPHMGVSLACSWGGWPGRLLLAVGGAHAAAALLQGGQTRCKGGICAARVGQWCEWGPGVGAIFSVCFVACTVNIDLCMDAVLNANMALVISNTGAYPLHIRVAATLKACGW